MSASTKRAKKREDWENLDVNADSRLPTSHGLIFLVNSLVLAAVPVYLFSAIFDLTIEENAIAYGIVSVIAAIILTLACQNRSKNIRNRLIVSRGVELESTLQLKNKDGADEKAKLRSQVLSRTNLTRREAEKQRAAINHEALALSLAYTNAMFLASIIALTFFILRSQAAQLNYAFSTSASGALMFYLSTLKGK